MLTSARSPCAPIDFAAAIAFASSRPQRTTSAPRSFNSFAISNPIPELPPVTSARMSESFMRRFYVSPAATRGVRRGASSREEIVRDAGVLASRAAAHAREAELQTEIAGIDLRRANECGAIAVRGEDVHRHDLRCAPKYSGDRHRENANPHEPPRRPRRRFPRNLKRTECGPQEKCRDGEQQHGVERSGDDGAGDDAEKCGGGKRV